MKELRSAGHSLRSIAATISADKFVLSHAGVKKILLSAGAGKFAGLDSMKRSHRGA